MSIMVIPQVAYDELVRVIVEAWEAIPQDYIDHLIKGMDSRVNAVHTEY